MTFSIVGRDGDAYGVAVASKFLAVGSAVPAVRAALGAIATQAYANLSYRPDGLGHLAEGSSSAAAAMLLTTADEGQMHRQLGIVSASGGCTFTGSECHAWAGGVAGDDYAIQGNILVGEQVVTAMEQAWTSSTGQPLAYRLLAALGAGDQAGGDRRGRQSAALLVARPGAGYGGDDVEYDLRVDDHDQPVPELRRLTELHDLYFGEPSAEGLLPLQGAVADEVRELLARLGHEGPDLDALLDTWASSANFEMRLRPGSIDPVVLEQLRLGRT
ncbi:DUF1028 domain-containing protein [Angustibacter sp. McL0619]|uniref:DUF1028 domain-containing protein n=1 Tax=Angustibacter sp. McL0619 TaxID=3415676 RepID=UPI003CE79A7E